MMETLFANNFGLLRFAVTRDIAEADVVVLGIPYDLGTLGRSGARHGPEAVRRASVLVGWEEKHWPWQFAHRDELEVVDYGDIWCVPGRHQEFLDTLQSTVGEILDAGKTLFALGGDHYISLPLIREHARRYGPVSLLHFDAHGDTEAPDQEFYHGNMFSKGLAEGIINRDSSIQVGIRTELEEAHPFKVINADELIDWPLQRVVETIVATVGDAPVYLSFDIDCLDPAYAPGTGTPAPGGPSSNRMIRLLRSLVDVDVVGMDLVEVNPAHDPSQVTAVAASALALELLHLQARRRTPSLPRP